MVQMRGSLIVFEGVDRSGKSTQSSGLVARLNAARPNSAVAWRSSLADRSTASGKLIDAYLADTREASSEGLDDRTIHLLFAANRAEAMRSLTKNLLAGKTVVVDRYAFSGVAYTLAKKNMSLSKEWCMSVDAGIIRPDLVVFLDIPTKDASLRGDYGLERYEKLDFQESVRNCFLELVDKSYWQVLDARQSKESLSETIINLANSTIEASGKEPLLPLWT
ncbi:thymidylate kinase-like protein [Obelidium mucronatum]|nr:thymidylate kinase-like protein [Obelidium mucronatum]